MRAVWAIARAKASKMHVQARIWQLMRSVVAKPKENVSFDEMTNSVCSYKNYEMAVSRFYSKVLETVKAV